MGVGMPAHLKLEEFGSHVWAVFGSPPFHVGSSLTEKRDWRDVDVRTILSDDEWEAWGLSDEEGYSHKWHALCLAFSALGREMTGLPIDFQIQQQTRANKLYDGPRSALGLVPWRRIL